MSSFRGVLSVQASQTFVPSAVIEGNRERPVLLETFIVASNATPASVDRRKRMSLEFPATGSDQAT